MTADINQLHNQVEYQSSQVVQVRNGNIHHISHTGSNSIHSLIPSKYLILKNILHVPALTKNLLIVFHLTIFIEFHSNFCVVKDKDIKKPLLQGNLKHRLYQIPTQSLYASSHSIFFLSSTVHSSPFSSSD